MKFLSAPWRWEFISNCGKKSGCVFCQAQAMPDREAMILWRGRKFFVLLNKYPYSTGHLMIAPLAHLATPGCLGQDEWAEMGELTTRAMAILEKNFHPDGFNIGMNIGPAAGAGVKDHFHQHLVPRWQGDANFMALVGQTRVLSYDQEEVFRIIGDAFHQ